MGPKRSHRRLDQALVAAGGLAIAALLAVSLGAITIPGINTGAQTAQASQSAALAAQRTAANRQWASTACTTVLNWKNELKRDTSLKFGFSALPRVQDAIAATTRMLKQLDTLGPPPSAQTGQARADVARLRSELEARVHEIQSDAQRVTSGDLLAIGALVSDLEHDRTMASQLGKEVRQVVSVDLGLSLLETRACRQLVGIPI
jgi:hypothetical protein